ncbi:MULTISPECIES: non-homologous end joining protein Ku [Streptosporangium]|uniref:Non-homologous end joining protein Ku n=1 Tax=Streptosporangium brasiliense TaxID=47480 RepID=A0ABT9R7H8_9ACTN|nr:Ku protein [Streptosporangium brasiliense]MDP9865201.1 DNA end-binding protein Ku [Streptosporangium brasiliense]
MRSIWKGTVSFGLITIPVRLFGATERRDVTFHLVHGEDGGRIRFRRFCQVCEEEVSFADVAKGYEFPNGDMVVLAGDDFEDLPLSTSRRIEVLQFSPADQIDPILLDKSYYLEPDAVGVKPYALLRDALERSGLVAVVKVALRQRESLATLRVREGVFVLETMLWPDEVRPADFTFLEEGVDVRPQEVRMAESLIEAMVADFDPSAHKDAYREAVHEVIEAKVAGREIVPAEVPVEEGPPADLMAALRASVEAAKKDRRGTAPARERAPAEPAAGEAGNAGDTGNNGKAGEKEKASRKRNARRPA